MHLKELALKQFRNISSQTVTLNPEFNFIHGRNAQGKTNIIEAIYYMAELKSFRTSNRHDLVQHNQDFASIQGVFEKDDMSWDIQIHLSHDGRKILLNQKAPKSRKDYYEMIPLILFEPKHIYLFRDSPSKRRDYLNRALYLQDASFLKLIRDYEKVITQKNRALKDRMDASLIDVWNDQLVDLGSQIIQLRFQWFHQLESLLADEYQQLSHSGERFRLDYQPGQGLAAEFVSGAVPELSEIQQALQDKLAEKRYAESERRESLVGPHRDDFVAFFDERHVGQYGSQGENRSAIIALKLAQLKMFAQKYQKTPLFLLDDVASELDEHRCQYLFSYLRDEQTQVFLTTTENKIAQAPEYQGHASSYLLENGSIGQVL